MSGHCEICGQTGCIDCGSEKPAPATGGEVVQRYAVTGDYAYPVIESDDGEFVLASALEAMTKELDALRARLEQVEWALLGIVREFPTDTDMEAAGWECADIDRACNAYDKARAALAAGGGK